MTDATLNLKVDATEVEKGKKSLDDLAISSAKAEEQTKDLKKSTTELNTGFSQAGAEIKKLVGAYLGFQAAKAAITGVISTTAEFGQSIANLSAITGATGKDLAFYSAQAKEIGRTTSLSASQAAEGFKLIASAKPDLLASATSLAAVTREAVTLAEATGISLPESAAALGAALNQFQLPASDANRVINALAASSQLGTAEVAAVTEAMRNAGSAANSLGLDFEETVAGIQALAASGRQGADAGTALRQVLLRLEATGNEQLQPSIVGLVGSLQKLKTMNLDNTELMDLFGQEAFTAATSLLAQADVAEKLNNTLRGTNTATEQAAINMDTLRGDWLEGKSAVEALMIALGEKLEPALRASAQATTEVVSAWAQAVEKGRTLNQVLEDQLEVMNKIASSRTNMYLLGLGGAISQAAASQAEMNVMVKGFVGPFQQMTTMVKGFVGPFQQMTTMVEGFVGPLQRVEQGTKKYTDALDEHIKVREKFLEEQSRQQQVVRDTIRQLEQEQQALGMTDRAQAIFNATTEAYNRGAAPEQIARIAELTALNYDLAESNTKTGKAAEEAANQAKENWQRTHEYMTNALIDIMDNGDNAFDSIAKSFERMVKRMIAEWAASGLMNLFGVGGGSIGGSVTSSLLSTGAKSAIGSIFGAGASASALPAAGATAAEWASFYGGGTTATAGGGLTSSIGALASNPATWAVAALAYTASQGFWKDPDGYKRSYAGLLTAPTPGAAGSTFSVDPFASGFRATGIAHNASMQDALSQIEVFRALDAQITELARKAGITVDASGATFDGVGKEGQAGTAGTFLGIGGMTSQADLLAMVDLYATQLADHMSGADEALLNAVRSASSAEEVIKALGDALEDQSSQLTDMDKARKSASESIYAAYKSGLSELDSIQRSYAEFQRYAERGLTAAHIAQFTGLMESEIQAVLDKGKALSATPAQVASNDSSWDRSFDLWGDTARQAYQPDAEFKSAIVASFLAAGMNQYGEPIDGSHANGLDYVPFDGYRAELHRGERVQTAAQARNSDQTSAEMLSEMRSLVAYSRRAMEYSKKTADLLTRVTRDGDALLTEAA